MHYIIIILVVTGIVLWQLFTFVSTIDKIHVFKVIFLKAGEVSILKDEDGNVVGINSKYLNKVWKTIIESINKYLSNNKGSVSDFHLMKDIVDRNCDAQEEEIHTQIPIPLYLGLVGTMLGILIGIGFLVGTGGLYNLLNSSSNGNGADGVQVLLSGVAIAMISSICGIGLTTWGSSIIKNAKTTLEMGKNTFLTWMQAELLPNLSNDTAQTLGKMANNLTNFNRTFAVNTRELKETLSTVTSSYIDLSKILTAINNMKIVDIASANIKVYEKLKNCTDEIGKLGVYLQDLNQYQANTTEAIENLNTFFNKGIEKIDEINIGVGNALKRFGEYTKNHLDTLLEELDSQILNVNNAAKRQQADFQKRFDDQFATFSAALNMQNDELLKHFTTISSQMQIATNEQQEIFRQKMKDTSALVEELRNLSAIKESITKFERATNEQNRKIDRLSDNIEKLAHEKSGGVARLKLQPIEKYAVLIGCSIISLAGLSYLITQIAIWIDGLINYLR